MITQKHDLDVTPSGVLPVINTSQYDVGRIIKFYLYNDSEVYDIPVGTSVLVNGIKPNGDAFSYSATYTENVVTVTLTDQMTVIAGEVRCELRLANGGNDIGTTNFTLLVEKAPFDSSIPISDTEIPAIIELARTEQYNAEAWAVGQRNGVDVPNTDPAYHNNAKYWAGHTTSSISGLSDVDVDGLTNGQILKYNSTSQKWENSNESGGGASALTDLTDVSLSLPSDGQALIYDSDNNEWVNGDIPDTDALEDLTDVTLSTPTNGQVLKYNSTSQKWENANESGGGGGVSNLYELSDVTIALPDGGQVLTYDSVTGKWINQAVPTPTISVDAEDVSYDNTSSGLAATDVQDAIDEVNTEVGTKASTTDVANKHKVTDFEVTTTGWTSDTTSQSGTTLYKKQISLNHVYASPSVDIGAASGYTLPTVAEQEAYDLISYVTVDNAVPCLYLYASDIPTTAFYINVEGVD